MDKKNIAMIHYQVGRTDGVSLEIEKWKHVLEEMGHTVHLVAGDLGAVEGTLIPEMYHHIPEIERLKRNTFRELRDYDVPGYQAELDRWTEILVERLRTLIIEKQINFLIPQNVWSVAASPPVAIALERVRQTFGLPALAHNHDFYWERVDGVALTCAPAVELADKYLPPRDPLVSHVVINSLAKGELFERKGIPSTVVPNVFDFDAPAWTVDDHNNDFRQRIGLHENDVLILQATRMITRKGIELAIDFVKALDTPARRAQLQACGLYNWQPFTADSRIVLVLAGYARDDSTGHYLDQLKEKAQRDGVDTLIIGDLIAGDRQIKNGVKRYSLWDAYVHADFITYPSLWEGWGNQLLEALRAKLPLMLFEYPVYQADIKDKGLKVVSLGHQLSGRDEHGLVTISPEIIETAADQAIDLLTDAELRRETVEHNFQIGKKFYSMAALHDQLHLLMSDQE